MPCNTVVENAVDLGQCDRQTLIEALKELGWTPNIFGNGAMMFSTEYGRVTLEDGEVKMYGANAPVEQVRDTIKRAVMAKAIEKAAKKFAWKSEKITVKGKTVIRIKKGK